MAAGIQVVLQKEVDKLGDSGDVVRVRPGYARNFLYPRSLALPATVANLSRVEELRTLASERAEEARKAARELASKVESLSVKLTRAVGEGNKMFGSVTGKDIEEAYAEKGIEIDRRAIELSDPIRTLGLTEVSVRLHADVSATLRVEVVKKV